MNEIIKKFVPENYKGYVIRYIQKIIGNSKIVEGSYASKIANKIVTVRELDKVTTTAKIKALIDFDESKRRLARLK